MTPQSKALSGKKTFESERDSLGALTRSRKMSMGEHTNRALKIERKYKRDYHTGESLNK